MMAFTYTLIAVLVFLSMTARLWRDRSVHVVLVLPYAAIFAALWPIWSLLKLWQELFGLHGRHY